MRVARGVHCTLYNMPRGSGNRHDGGNRASRVNCVGRANGVKTRADCLDRVCRAQSCESVLEVGGAHRVIRKPVLIV